MSKIGISIKLDVKKLDKARFFAAQSGALYVDLTMFLDPDNEGQYGDHGFATQSITKEEREQNVQMPILGNGKIFYGLQELKSGGQSQGGHNQAQRSPSPTYEQVAPKINPLAPQDVPYDDTIPF